jgi:hypothetical protein
MGESETVDHREIWSVERHASFTYDLATPRNGAFESLVFVSGKIITIHVQSKPVMVLRIQWAGPGERQYWKSGGICRVVLAKSSHLVQLIELYRVETHCHSTAALNVHFDNQTHEWREHSQLTFTSPGNCISILSKKRFKALLSLPQPQPSRIGFCSITWTQAWTCMWSNACVWTFESTARAHERTRATRLMKMQYSKPWDRKTFQYCIHGLVVYLPCWDVS